MKKIALVSGLVVWLLVVGMVTAGTALAQGPGLYIGAGIGMSEIDWAGSYADLDDQDNAIKAFVGYAFNKGFALEAGYVDLGSFALDPEPTDPTLRVTQEATAAYLSGIGTVALSDRMGLIAKIGIAMWDFDVDVTQAGIAQSATEDGLDTMFGIGFQFDLEPLLLRIEYEQYQDVGDQTYFGPPVGPMRIDGTDVDVFGLSVALKF
jgi:hypothetical protein